MSADELRALKLERLKRLQAVDGLRAELFDKQLAFVDDKARRRTAKCGRRAGKTTVFVILLILRALRNPGRTCVYIALTKGHAKRLAWPTLQAMDKKHNIGMRYNEVELRATLPNGAVIWLTGADKATEIEKLRGDAYPCVVIDEAASFGIRVNYLVDDVLDAALEDYDGECVLGGTPGAACIGKFHEVTTKQTEWSRHAWTVKDNCKFPRWAGKANWRKEAEKMLARKLKEKGWLPDNPTFRREWLGEWIRDDQSLVYRYDPIRNSKPAESDLECVMGVDLGYDDAFSLEVVGWNKYSGDVWELAAYKASGLTPTDMAALIRDYKELWKPRSIVADTGGLGKAIVEEFNKRHGLSIRPAEKAHKHEYIRMLNDDLLAGRAHALPNGVLANEWSVLQWTPGDRRIEDPRYDNHAADAFLYAWREAGHYRHVPGTHRPPAPGTPEAIELEAVAMFDDDKEENWFD